MWLLGGSLSGGIHSLHYMQNCIKWLYVRTVNPLRAVLFSLALRSCWCYSSGWALSPAQPSPTQPCLALLSAAWGCQGPQSHPWHVIVTPRLPLCPLRAAPGAVRGSVEGAGSKHGWACQEANIHSNWLSFLLSLWYRACFYLSRSGSQTGECHWLSPKCFFSKLWLEMSWGLCGHPLFPRMRPMSLGMLSLVRGAVLTTGLLRTAWVDKNKTNTKPSESLKTKNLTEHLARWDWVLYLPVSYSVCTCLAHWFSLSVDTLFRWFIPELWSCDDLCF